MIRMVDAAAAATRSELILTQEAYGREAFWKRMQKIGEF